MKRSKRFLNRVLKAYTITGRETAIITKKLRYSPIMLDRTIMKTMDSIALQAIRSPLGRESLS
jgi:hypothetical protein